jgi:hypothetical protein
MAMALTSLLSGGPLNWVFVMCDVLRLVFAKLVVRRGEIGRYMLYQFLGVKRPRKYFCDMMRTAVTKKTPA